MSVAPLVRANSRMQFERQRNATVLTLSGNDSNVYFPSILSTSYSSEVNPGYMTDVYTSGTANSACRRAAILSCVKSGKPQLQPLADASDGPLAPIADMFTPILDRNYGMSTHSRIVASRGWWWQSAHAASRLSEQNVVKHSDSCTLFLSGDSATRL